MSELIIYSGKLKGKRLILPNREVVIGRDEDCHMRIASSLISRKHCTLKAAPNGIWVRDLESQNGTYVNDVAITDPYLMKAGDMLRVGAALFQVPRARPAIDTAEEEGISDDEISTWLTEEEQTASSSVPDTTVIKGRHPPKSSPAITAAAPPAPATGTTPDTSSTAQTTSDSRTVPAYRPPQKSVKEQAAEIIKRHWELVRGEQPD
jgi:pSer/pThr/pTyr-binding forkhead associated (FHA) protein